MQLSPWWAFDMEVDLIVSILDKMSLLSINQLFDLHITDVICHDLHLLSLCLGEVLDSRISWIRQALVPTRSERQNNLQKHLTYPFTTKLVEITL